MLNFMLKVHKEPFWNQMIGLPKASSFRMNCNTMFNCVHCVQKANAFLEEFWVANGSNNAFSSEATYEYVFGMSMYFWLCYVFLDLLMLIFVNFLISLT